MCMAGMLTQPSSSQGSPNNGDGVRSGHITPAFSGAQDWAQWLNNPCLLGGPLCLLGGPQQWGQNQKWLHNPCYLTGAQSGDTSKLIHGQLHIGDGPQKHHFWGKEAQNGQNRNKKCGKGGVHGCTLHKKCMCVCTSLLPIFQENYPNCASQALQDKRHMPNQ